MSNRMENWHFNEYTSKCTLTYSDTRQASLFKAFAYDNFRNMLQYLNANQLLHMYCFTLGNSLSDSKLRYKVYFFIFNYVFCCCYTTYQFYMINSFLDIVTLCLNLKQVICKYMYCHILLRLDYLNFYQILGN